MSVTGEFYRLAEACVAFLDASGSPEADRWKRQLEQAAAHSSVSLSEAAEQALQLLEGEEAPPAFVSARERDGFAELAEHLAAICRALLGRSADSLSTGGKQP